MKPPPTVDRMTPSEAWNEGYRAGREELAAEMQRDALAAAASDGIEAQNALNERLSAIQRRLTQVENEQRDNARLVVGLGERMTELEGGKVE